jgi:hypothetical protein
LSALQRRNQFTMRLDLGEESFDSAMQYAYANVDGSEIVDDAILNERYYLTRNPIEQMQLAIASVRMAVNLQQIFE